MTDLQHYQAKFCNTVGAQVIHQGKVLLIKHTKLGIWLPPGGHIEEGELPHIAAEREVLEETGVDVRTYSSPVLGEYDLTEYLPTPIISNLHWINQENYQKRLADPAGFTPQPPWKRGCEQHHIFIYLARPVGDTKTNRNLEETEDIGWFTLAEVQSLDTAESIKAELAYGFKIATD